MSGISLVLHNYWLFQVLLIKTFLKILTLSSNIFLFKLSYWFNVYFQLL